STATKQSVVDPNQWYLSESVLTEIEFNPSTINFDSVVSAWDINLFASRIHGYSLVYTDDNYYLKFEQRFDPDAELVEQRHSFKIYAGGSGTLYYTDLHAWISDGAAQTSSTTSRSGSLSVTNAMLDAQGYLLISIISYAYIGNYININFAYLTSAGSNTIVYQNNALSVIPDIDSHEIRFDVLYFQRDKIVNTIRSEHKYASAFTMINKKIIPSVPHAKEITVNLMEDETVTSVNPSASWSVSSNVLTISSPVELNYEVLTSRTCSNLLAIRDFSTDYLTDVGFETGQYLTDWTVNYGNISLNSQTVFEGYYSVSTKSNDYFTVDGDACDFEEDTDEFDIKLNGLDTIDIVFVHDEYKLRLYEGGAATKPGARRDDLAIDTNNYRLFKTEIWTSGTNVDRVQITLHFSDATTQDFVELIPTGTMEEFEFIITADKTIEMIDIYYGDSSWFVPSGDIICVSFIEIVDAGAEITLTLPENDYYLSYSTYIESGNVTLTTNDQTIVNNGSITDRWINNFVFTHTDTVTFTILFDDLD
ncbi:MAG: hypothetical protein KAU62_07215, partial [Candidatus Heimdallarchaeota archaeon]|nr:hypothetical protein [Candidatus Heimdallarchaeota archaeon]MCK4610930.1 hypothetical protein [Candidatus Heimdallarchaeota archaeon]